MNRAVSRVTLRAKRISGAARPVRVGPQQQRVVVEHLLEVRHHPRARRRCSGRIRRPAGRRCRRGPSRCRCARRPPAAPASPVRSWLRSSASSSADGGNFGAPPNPPLAVSSSPSTAGDGVVAQRGLHLGSAAGQPGRHRPQLADDLVGGLLDLVAPVLPGVADGGEQLQEVRLRVVGAAEERPAVGGQETRHRPAALPGQRDGGVHVDRVDVGPLLAVHLDAHEPGVHRGRDLVVLERLVGHHMAPVAGGVADRQQDRHVPLGRLGQRLGRPLPPVHRVVGVLAQIRAGGLAEGVARARCRSASLVRCDPLASSGAIGLGPSTVPSSTA